MKGFSILEVLITLSILSIVGSVGFTTFNDSRQAGITRFDAMVYVDALREAMLKSRLGEHDTDWGVKITGGNTIVFSGTSYLSRATARDRVYDSSDTVTVSGVTEIVFSKYSGIPNTTGTTTFSNALASASVVVGASGLISQ